MRCQVRAVTGASLCPYHNPELSSGVWQMRRDSSAYCLCTSKIIYKSAHILQQSTGLQRFPSLIWPPVWLVEPHQQHITAPQFRYELEEFGGSLKCTPLLLSLPTETPLKNQLSSSSPASHHFRNRCFQQILGVV